MASWLSWHRDTSAALADRAKFFCELRAVAQLRGYRDGWSAHKFKERFGIFPPEITSTFHLRRRQTRHFVGSNRVTSRGPSRGIEVPHEQAPAEKQRAPTWRCRSRS